MPDRLEVEFRTIELKNVFSIALSSLPNNALQIYN